MTEEKPSPDKVALRAWARRLRRREAARLGSDAARAVSRLGAALPLACGALVAGYWPLPGEMDPRPLMAELVGLGHPLCLPVVTAEGEALAFRAWSPGDALEEGPFATLHPAAGGNVFPQVVLVPLLAFDRRGFRLGQGGGYYDRTLAALGRRGGVASAGLAFSAQEVDQVPADPWDARLDWIVTETDVIRAALP